MRHVFANHLLKCLTVMTTVRNTSARLHDSLSYPAYLVVSVLLLNFSDIWNVAGLFVCPTFPCPASRGGGPGQSPRSFAGGLAIRHGRHAAIAGTNQRMNRMRDRPPTDLPQPVPGAVRPFVSCRAFAAVRSTQVAGLARACRFISVLAIAQWHLL